MKCAVLLIVAVCFADAYKYDPLIVGGNDATINSWPWQGSLRKLRSSGSKTHTCGCSLLNARWALTAAHCVDDSSLSVGDYEIVWGGHHLESETGFDVKVNVSQFIIHPSWSPSGSGFPNDIALIRFTSDVVYSNGIQPANLINNNDDFAGATDCYITGWGRLYGGAEGLPQILQEARTTVLSYNDCRSRNGGSVRTDHICAYDPSQITGGCNGDSGGPLVCRKTPTSVWTLLGAASWVYSGCNTRYATVYARASSYRDWIFQNSGV